MSQRARIKSKKYQQEWSTEYKYKHIHTGEYCTFESYVAEYLILRWTETFKMDKPSYKFWSAGDRYHDAFMRNMKATKSLKKKFEEHIILGAIKSDYFQKIFHIGLKAYGPRGWKYNQVALEAIKRYHNEVRDSQKLKQNSNEIKSVEKTKKEKPAVRRVETFSNKKSMINRLRNL